jgi:hypothetical protein
MDRDALREEVEAMVLAEAERVGPSAIQATTIWNRFQHRGAGRSTVFRWVAEMVESGRVGRHLAAQIKLAAARRQKRTAPPAETVKSDLARVMPTAPRMDHIAVGGGTIAVLDKIRACVALAEQVMEQAKGEDGHIRLTKTGLAASEHLRRTLETALRLQESIREAHQIDRFQDELMEAVGVIARSYPEAGEALTQEFTRIAARWTAP